MIVVAKSYLKQEVYLKLSLEEIRLLEFALSVYIDESPCPHQTEITCGPIQLEMQKLADSLTVWRQQAQFNWEEKSES